MSTALPPSKPNGTSEGGTLVLGEPIAPGEFVEINVTHGELGKAVYEAGPERHWEVSNDGETWACWPYRMCGPLSAYRFTRMAQNHEATP